MLSPLVYQYTEEMLLFLVQICALLSTCYRVLAAFLVTVSDPRLLCVRLRITTFEIVKRQQRKENIHRGFVQKLLSLSGERWHHL